MVTGNLMYQSAGQFKQQTVSVEELSADSYPAEKQIFSREAKLRRQIC